MPPNLSGTLFMHWLGQQQAARQQQREDERFSAEMAERGSRMRALENESRRKDTQALAREAGAQAQALGEPVPQLEDPGMQLQAGLGSGAGRVANLQAARQTAAAERLERLRQIGLVDREALRQENAIELQRMRGQQARDVARLRGKGGVTVNVGDQGIGLTTSARTDAMKQIRNADHRLKQLDAIDASAAAAGGYDAASTFSQRGETAGAGFVGKIRPSAIGPGTRQLLTRQTTFEADLANFSNDMLHDLSGAAVNPSEWERLKRSFPNTGDSGAEKKAKVEAWRRNLQVIRAQGVDALVNGIRAGQTLEEVGLTIPGGAPAAAAGASKAPDDMDARELLDAGLITPEEYEIETGGAP